MTSLLTLSGEIRQNETFKEKWFGMKPKVRARAAELNAEPELFQFKANITYLIKSKAQKYHILREQHLNVRKIMTYG